MDSVPIGRWLLLLCKRGLGRLPGDMKNFRLYLPIATSLLISVG
jgi:Protein of unknown function (DUF2905)